jgi:hypothetical protein
VRPTRQLGLGALLICATALAASPAVADEYDALLARAIAAKERALDTNDPAAWEDALSLFQQADRIRSTKESKYELGGAAARLRQDDLAVEAYESALALGLEGAARDKAQEFIQQHQNDVGRLEVVGPAGAEVWVGTRQRGVLPLGRPLVVFAGKRRVRVAHGEREQLLEVEITAGKQQRADFVPLFAESPTPATPPPKTTPSAPRAPEGPILTQPAPDDDHTLAWTLVIAGGATAAVGLGVVIGASSSIDTRRERLARLCAVPNGEDGCTSAQPGQREAAQSEVDSIATWKALRIGGWVGLGVGAVAAGTGLVLLLGGSREKASAHWSVAPLPGGGALTVSGAL